MSLNSYIKKLRIAADALEDLLESNPFIDEKKRKMILKGKNQPLIIKNLTDKKKAWVEDYEKSQATPLPVTNPIERKTAKGFKYPKGTHWTQKPENAYKLKRVVKQMNKINKARG